LGRILRQIAVVFYGGFEAVYPAFIVTGIEFGVVEFSI
jgi:hypothetical protein